MLSNGLRQFFYSLHSSSGFPRKIADCMSWGFMKGVEVFNIKPKCDRTPLLLISHKYKFIYIGIPKVATRSLKNAIYDQGMGTYSSEYFENKRAFETTLAAYPDYYKFSLARNPYARILSCYNSKIGHEDLSLLKQARIMSFYDGLYPGMPFEEFCAWLNTDEGQDHCADRHWMSQYKFLQYNDGTPICDFVGRYENLNEDLTKVMNDIGAPIPKLENVGWLSGSKDYSDNYSEKAKENIKRRYKKDLELYSYKF